MPNSTHPKSLYSHFNDYEAKSDRMGHLSKKRQLISVYLRKKTSEVEPLKPVLDRISLLKMNGSTLGLVEGDNLHIPRHLLPPSLQHAPTHQDALMESRKSNLNTDLSPPGGSSNHRNNNHHLDEYYQRSIQHQQVYADFCKKRNDVLKRSALNRAANRFSKNFLERSDVLFQNILASSKRDAPKKSQRNQTTCNVGAETPPDVNFYQSDVSDTSFKKQKTRDFGELKEDHEKFQKLYSECVARIIHQNKSETSKEKMVAKKLNDIQGEAVKNDIINI